MKRSLVLRPETHSPPTAPTRIEVVLPVPWQWRVVAVVDAAFGSLHILSGIAFVALPNLVKPTGDPLGDLVGSVILFLAGIFGWLFLVIGVACVVTALGLALGRRWASVGSAILLGLYIAGSLSLLLRGLMGGTLLIAPFLPLGFAVMLLTLLVSGASARKRLRAKALLSA